MAAIATQQRNTVPEGHAPRRRGPEEDRLEVFVGSWTLEGTAFDSPFGPAAPITAKETWEWLPGGVFLVHRLHGRLGDQEMACIEVTHWDEPSRSYKLHTFYNDGTRNEWRATEDGGAWTIRGEWTTAEQTNRVRCLLRFHDHGRTASGTWAYAQGDGGWRTFWETRLTRDR